MWLIAREDFYHLIVSIKSQSEALKLIKKSRTLADKANRRF
jgi:hypothetical protein